MGPGWWFFMVVASGNLVACVSMKEQKYVLLRTARCQWSAVVCLFVLFVLLLCVYWAGLCHIMSFVLLRGALRKTALRPDGRVLSSMMSRLTIISGL